jgi:cyclophilin family peptidyl-prolyl cis-trans isomerase
VYRIVWEILAKMDLIEFETTAGTFCLEMYRLHAPKTCYNFTELVKMGRHN